MNLSKYDSREESKKSKERATAAVVRLSKAMKNHDFLIARMRELAERTDKYIARMRPL